MSPKKAQQQFVQKETYLPDDVKERALIDAFANLTTAEHAAAFIRDLMTPAEIAEFANRLEIARLLLEGYSYMAIAEKVGTSTTTVTRVSHWLYSGCGGYWKVLKG